MTDETRLLSIKAKAIRELSAFDHGHRELIQGAIVYVCRQYAYDVPTKKQVDDMISEIIAFFGKIER
jgi:hypothetical protein